jgi:uncharacterized protein YjdB
MTGFTKRISAIAIAALIAFDTPLCALAYDIDSEADAFQDSSTDSFDMEITDEEIYGEEISGEELPGEEIYGEEISGEEFPGDEITDEYDIEPEAAAEIEAAEDIEIMEEASEEASEDASDNTENSENTRTMGDIENLKSDGDEVVYLVVGQSVNLDEFLKNTVTEKGYDLTTKGGKFTLEDGKIISLSAKGIVKAKKKGGCYIYWSTPDKHGKLKRRAVLIDVQVYKAEISEKTKTLTYVGQTYDFSYNVSYDTDNPPVSYETSNEKVCTVDPATGMVTAVAKGTAKVSAIWGGGKFNTNKFKLTGTIKVNVPGLSKTEATVMSGGKLKLTVKNVPKGTYVEWEKKNGEGCIDISSKGLTCTVTALYPGTENVVAWIDERPYECAITVPEVTVKKDSFTLDPKKTATVSLKGTKYKPAAFTWRTSAPTVATVNNKGKIKAVGRGYATIFAEKDGIVCAALVTVNKSKKNDKNIPVDNAEAIEKTTVPADATEDTVLGSVSDGCQLTVEAGTFAVDANISATPISTKALTEMGAYREGVFEEIISPVNISCEGYKEGDFFGTNVSLTVPMGKPGETITDPAAYMFAYYDENTKTLRYMYPDSYDLEKNEMTINLPHFSNWVGVKVTEAEELDAFLDSYSTKRAIEEGRYTQAASDLEPYIRKKAEALNLRDEALKDLVQATINAVAGRAGNVMANGGYAKTGATVGSVSKAMTGIARGIIDGDEYAAQAGLEDMTNAAIQEAWNSLKFSERAGAIFDPKIAKGVSDQSVNIATGAYKMYECFDKGDTTGAMKELGNMMMNVHPAVELGTKGTRFVASCVNVEFTYWKANQVEELYHIYKNGFELDFFGNYVIPGDKETFLEYLNCSSGFTMAKGVNRFYQMDKRDEIWPDLKQRNSAWKKYASYDDLPDSEKSKVEAYLEKGLIDYFELRMKQEEDAEKIKAQEQMVIQTMLHNRYGALVLKDSNYMEFFGEESAKDYSLTKRLEYLVKVRSYISKFVDEEKLKKDSNSVEAYNYGDLMNTWVEYAAKNRSWESDENMQDTIDDFLFYLQDIEYLKPGLNTKYAGFDNGDLRGGFSTEHDFTMTLWMIGYFDPTIRDDEGNEDFEAEKVPKTVDGRYIIEDDRTVNKLISGINMMRIAEDGTFSYNSGGVSISGYINPSTRLGSGTFSIHSSYSKSSGYTLDDFDNFIHNDKFPEGVSLFTTPLSYDEEITYQGSFKIVPTAYDYLNFRMKGTATIDYNIDGISEVQDYWLRDTSKKARSIPGTFFGSKTWDDYENNMIWYLVPKTKNN